MASPFKIVLYSTDAAAARRASRAAFDRIAALDAILSDYDPDSELSRLSQSAGGPPVPVSADLFDVLERSQADVRALGRRVRRHDRPGGPALAAGPPRPQAARPGDWLAEARPLVGSDKMVLDRTRGPSSSRSPG